MRFVILRFRTIAAKGRFDMRVLLSIGILLLVVSCSQKGQITVRNESAKDIEVYIEGMGYILEPNVGVTQEIDIGRKFIFGPSDKKITIEGAGECVFPFIHIIKLEDEETKSVSIEGNAGTIILCNSYTSQELPLYLIPCGSQDWGEPVEYVPPLVCTAWVVEPGCWNVKLGNFVDNSCTALYIELDICEESTLTCESGSWIANGNDPPKVNVSGYRRLNE
jgi:hypothetical protein